MANKSFTAMKYLLVSDQICSYYSIKILRDAESDRDNYDLITQRLSQQMTKLIFQIGLVFEKHIMQTNKNRPQFKACAFRKYETNNVQRCIVVTDLFVQCW